MMHMSVNDIGGCHDVTTEFQ